MYLYKTDHCAVSEWWRGDFDRADPHWKTRNDESIENANHDDDTKGT